MLQSKQTMLGLYQFLLVCLCLAEALMEFQVFLASRQSPRGVNDDDDDDDDDDDAKTSDVHNNYSLQLPEIRMAVVLRLTGSGVHTFDLQASEPSTNHQS